MRVDITVKTYDDHTAEWLPDNNKQKLVEPTVGVGYGGGLIIDMPLKKCTLSVDGR